MRLGIRNLQYMWRHWGTEMASELKLISGEPDAANSRHYWVSWVAMNSTLNQEKDDTFVILATVVIE